MKRAIFRAVFIARSLTLETARKRFCPRYCRYCFKQFVLLDLFIFIYFFGGEGRGLGESREGSGSCHLSGDQCVPKTKMFAIFLLPSRQRKQEKEAVFAYPGSRHPFSKHLC